MKGTVVSTLTEVVVVTNFNSCYCTRSLLTKSHEPQRIKGD